MKKLLGLMILLSLMTMVSLTGCGPTTGGNNTTTYTVTFDSQSATVAANPASKTVTTPVTTIDALPTAPTKDGYIFGGWYTAINGGGTAFTASTAVTANITVYAKWTANIITVTFDSQSATMAANPASKTVTTPATTIDALPTAPTKDGYIFGGWYTAINGGGTVFTASTAVTADITVYAKWDTPIVYISETGNDANDGLTKATPKGSFGAGLTVAKTYKSTTVCVSGNFNLVSGISNAGIYIGFMSNITISGGWNSGFTAQSLVSVLNGGKVCNHVVYIIKCFRLVLTNFAITGGYSSSVGSGDDSYGGGVLLKISDSNTIACIITNNHTFTSGGGLELDQSAHNLIISLVKKNSAGSQGGGFRLWWSHDNTISGTVCSNWVTNNANSWGGGLYLGYSSYNTISATISSNTAKDIAGGLFLYDADHNTVSGKVIANKTLAFGGGGGIAVNNGSDYNTISAIVSRNTAGVGTGGIGISQSFYNIISGTVSSNTAGANGTGGISLVDSQYNLIAGIVSDNIGGAYGGGINISSSDYNTNAGTVSRNTTTGNGGGVRLVSSSYTVFTSSFVLQNNHCDNDNSGGETGGGIYVTGGVGNNVVKSGAVIAPNYRGSGTGTVDNTNGSPVLIIN